MIGRLLLLVSLAAASSLAAQTIKSEAFDHDPKWDAFNNVIEPKKVTTVRQDFGYSATHVASAKDGEIGGLVSRAAKPAFYAMKLPPLTLEQKFSASGVFALRDTKPAGGMFFGFFNADQPGGSGRAVGSFGFDFDGEHTGGRLAVRLITADNQSCGTFVTPFIPGKYRPTPIRNDGSKYRWQLSYDPDAAGGVGQFHVSVTGEPAQGDAWEGKDFAVDLRPGMKKLGTTFDRFGLMNGLKAGGTISGYFGELKLNGQSIDLGADPGWSASGNRDSYEDRERAGMHHFGFSEKTSFAGGTAPGEVGGVMWRSAAFAYYADRVGPLSLDQPMEASGKVVLQVGSPDSEMYIGFFDSAGRAKPGASGVNRLAVCVAGPTRVGHYFSPVFTAPGDIRRRLKTAPVLAPGRQFDWTLRYDPAANDNAGGIKVTLGGESATLALQPGDKARGGHFDRFGLFTSNIGGQAVKIFFDDLKYTAAAP